MKNFILLNLIALFLYSPMSIASETEGSYLCQIEEKDLSLAFGFIEDLDDEEDWDSVSKYKVTIQSNVLPIMTYEEFGVAYQGDTYFYYTSLQSDLSLSLYLDELGDQVYSFQLNGVKYKFSQCEWKNISMK